MDIYRSAKHSLVWYILITIIAIIKKTELLISDFEHFHWLVGHRVAVHLSAVPIIWSAIKRADKSCFELELTQHGKVFYAGVFNETIIIISIQYTTQVNSAFGTR